jgi:hypothetical protein
VKDPGPTPRGIDWQTVRGIGKKVAKLFEAREVDQHTAEVEQEDLE